MPTITFPLQNYSPGVTSFGPVAVPQGLHGFVLTVARCTTATPTIWPNTTQKIALSLDCSYDGGVTYQLTQFFWDAVGGIQVGRGVEIPTWIVTCSVDPIQPTHLRGAFTVSGSAIRTSVTVTTL